MEDRVKDAALIAAQRLNVLKWLDTALRAGMPVCSATPRLRPSREDTGREEKVAHEVPGGIAEEISVEIPRGQNQGAQPTGKGPVKDRSR